MGGGKCFTVNLPSWLFIMCEGVSASGHVVGLGCHKKSFSYMLC